MTNDNEEKLIERITTCLEEFGMPKFQDRFPAMSILQLMKDSGWRKQPIGLVPLDEWYRRLEYNCHTRDELSIPSIEAYTEKFIRLEYAFNILKDLCSTFGASENVSIKEITELIEFSDMYLQGIDIEKENVYTLAQEIYDLIYKKEK